MTTVQGVNLREAAGRGAATDTYGAALASFLAAGIGAFAMGLVSVLNEAGIFVAPTLYGPAGGVTGRTALAAALWLLSWVVLHYRWRDRPVEPRRVFAITLILIALGIVGTFPPVWGLL
ncbi:MAG: hypothetical protein GEU90_19880 [Gemmatimonas sp.]|nr:hypothetical protein [Gemmatimonas sp.]